MKQVLCHMLLMALFRRQISGEVYEKKIIGTLLPANDINKKSPPEGEDF